MHGASAFWWTGDGPQVSTYWWDDADGGPGTEDGRVRFDAHGVPSDLVVGPGAVHWITFGGNPAFDAPVGELWRGTFDGSARKLIGGLSGSGHLVLSGGTAYFTTCRDRQYQDCVIESLDLGGGARRVHEQTRGEIRDLAADAHDVYWIDGARGEIRGMHGAVGTPWSVAGEQKDPRALALDKGRVYWVDHAAGTVNRASKSGGVVTLLATGQKGPVHISLDATDVFWANAGDGTIRRTEKLPVD